MRAFPTRPKKRFMRNCGETRGNGCGKKFRPTGKYSELCDKCWLKQRSDRGIRVTKTIHGVWTKREAAKKKGIKIRRLMGKWQYLYKSSAGECSLIQVIPSLIGRGPLLWELGYKKDRKKMISDDGEFEIERFTTKTKAYERIKEVLAE